MKNHIILLMGIAGTGKRTIGQELTLLDNHLKLVHHHAWTDPIVSLFGNSPDAFWKITETAWGKINHIRDIIFSSIIEDCPKKDNFIITFEMLDKNPYHQDFYTAVLRLVEAKKAYFYPIRLLCGSEELEKRVISTDRSKYFKTQDAQMIRQRSLEHEVFYTGHENEISLDVSHLTATDAAKTIYSKII